MRRNPLLYSNPSEIEQVPAPAATPQKEPAGKSSFFFYFIILANSLLVLFVLGFIWFLFLKSPDLQIKEFSSRLFGTGTPTEQVEQTIVAPEIETEILITPSQQEKDEIQQTKLKQMREKEELVAERSRLEKIKADLKIEKKRANEAQQAINSLKSQKEAVDDTKQITTSATIKEDNSGADTTVAAPEKQMLEIEQTLIEDNSAAKAVGSASIEPTVVPSATKKPTTSTTSSQVDLIMEALKNQ